MSFQLLKQGAALALVLSLGACSQAQLQTQLDSAKAENVSLQQQLANSTGTPVATASNAQGPANAKAGECYARVTTAAQFRTVQEQIVDQQASEKLAIVPATYGTDTEKVLVREATERLEIVPATYKTVTEQVMIQPETTVLQTVPAKYASETRQIKVRDA
jgi:hypothetical protein